MTKNLLPLGVSSEKEMLDAEWALIQIYNRKDTLINTESHIMYNDFLSHCKASCTSNCPTHTANISCSERPQEDFMDEVLKEILHKKNERRVGIDFGRSERPSWTFFTSPKEIIDSLIGFANKHESDARIAARIATIQTAKKETDKMKQPIQTFMPNLNRFYTYVKTDKDTGIKTLHLKAIFDDNSMVEVKGIGQLAFSDGGKGDMLPNAKEVGLMYAIVRRMCGIKNFRQRLEEFMKKEVVSTKAKKKNAQDGVPAGTEEEKAAK